jgi:hypothetical protein
MLYPLSYEGLACTFAQHAGRIVVRWLGLAASLQTVCAAPVPRAVDQLLATAPTRAADCTAGGVELRAGGRADRRGNDVVAAGGVAARRIEREANWLCCFWERPRTATSPIFS